MLLWSHTFNPLQCFSVMYKWYHLVARAPVSISLTQRPLGNNSRTHQAEEIQFTQRIENEPRMQEGLRSVHVGHGRRNGLRHVSYSHIPQKLRFEKISEITVTAWRGFAAPCKEESLGFKDQDYGMARKTCADRLWLLARKSQGLNTCTKYGEKSDGDGRSTVAPAIGGAPFFSFFHFSSFFFVKF